jgi:hypothetical protein
VTQAEIALVAGDRQHLENSNNTLAANTVIMADGL